MKIRNFILKVLSFLTKKLQFDGNDNEVMLNKYCKIGDSITEGMRLDIRQELSDKLYVTIGNNCMISCRFIFESKEGEVVIGDKVHIGGSSIICHSKITFGNNIFVAWGCTFYDHDSHSVDFRERRKDMERQISDYKQNKQNPILTKDWSVVNSAQITIKDDAWIGMNATILKGVTIGRGAIVGAGSVVTKDVPDWTIAAGNPAKVVKIIENC